MRWIILPLLAFSLAACSAPGASAQSDQTLAGARAGHQTRLVSQTDTDEPVERPPSRVLNIVQYPAPPGPMAAYVTPDPQDGQRHPAIIWITGGDFSTIGNLWGPRPATNDQTARAFRDAGIVVMYPSLRGGNQNPGQHEAAYGEVDDVLAAADWLAQQPWVDPDRIYLGGHSTGGTLVLLTSEMSDRFRAVFSFGPTAEMYPEIMQYLGAEVTDPQEIRLRSPIYWLASIQSPTFVFEGATNGNGQDLRALERASRNDHLHFYLVDRMDHFSILSPVTQVIAKKILADTGETPNISFTAQELARR